MPRNQPPYRFFKNASYAWDGLVDITTTESSFRIELFFLITLSIVIYFLTLPFWVKSLLFISMLLPLIVEIINSAIERAVDLTTKKEKKLAKRAKDAGAAAVLLSLVVTGLVWLTVLIHFYC
jgi:diacylglycerol kinase (ATP)